MDDRSIIERYNDFLKKANLPSTFCLYPWTHIDFDQSGDIMSCCRGNNNFGDWKNGEFSFDKWNENITQLRSSMMNDEWHSNCRDCYKKEQIGNRSLRHDIAIHAMNFVGLEELQNNVIPSIFKNPLSTNMDSIFFLEIRPSNVCNLQCIHCNEVASSKWNSFLKQFPEFSQELDLETSKITNHSISGFENIKNLLENLTNLTTVHFCGGEPLYDKDALNYLNSIQNKKNVFLSYATNGQTFPNDNILQIWKEFKKVTLSISVDASDDQYDYFRYPGKWTTFLKLVDDIRTNYPEIDVVFHVPINLFTLFSISEFIHTVEKYNVSVHFNTVHQPDEFSITALPLELKNKLMKDFSNCIKKDTHSTVSELYEYINNYIYSSDDFENEKSRMIEHFFQLDKYRKTSIKDSCPELYKYLKENKDD